MRRKAVLTKESKVDDQTKCIILFYVKLIIFTFLKLLI